MNNNAFKYKQLQIRTDMTFKHKSYNKYENSK